MPRVVTAADSEPDTGFTVAYGPLTCALQGLPGDLEEQPLLRVHMGGFAGANPKKLSIEVAHGIDKGTLPGVHLAAQALQGSAAAAAGAGCATVAHAYHGTRTRHRAGSDRYRRRHMTCGVAVPPRQHGCMPLRSHANTSEVHQILFSPSLPAARCHLAHLPAAVAPAKWGPRRCGSEHRVPHEALEQTRRTVL